MSTISSRPTKRYSIVDLMTIFVFFILLFTLFVIPFTGNLYSSLVTTNRTNASVSTNAGYSFSADHQYWTANCSRGWSSNSTCDEIVVRSQSCSISTESAYCSAYDKYLKQLSH
jgi:hypothetical protein